MMIQENYEGITVVNFRADTKQFPHRRCKKKISYQFLDDAKNNIVPKMPVSISYCLIFSVCQLIDYITAVPFNYRTQDGSLTLFILGGGGGGGGVFHLQASKLL